jgi:hypothetical protein
VRSLELKIVARGRIPNGNVILAAWQRYKAASITEKRKTRHGMRNDSQAGPRFKLSECGLG